jgi:hypothetical protein
LKNENDYFSSECVFKFIFCLIILDYLIVEGDGSGPSSGIGSGTVR